MERDQEREVVVRGLHKMRDKDETSFHCASSLMKEIRITVQNPLSNIMVIRTQPLGCPVARNPLGRREMN